jgi:hypothetical protein
MPDPFVRSYIAVLLLSLIWICSSAQGQGTQPVVGIHDSELTRALESMPASGATPTGTGYTGNQWWFKQWHYFVMPDAVKEALRSDGTAYTVVGDSNILAGVLTNANGSPRYPILISLGAEAIQDSEIAALTNYVAAGGFLFVGASSFTRNTNGTSRGDFAIANAMGIHMVNPALTNWYFNDSFAKSANHRIVADIPSGTFLWQMPESSEETSWPVDVHLIGETPNAVAPGLPHMLWQVQSSNATVIAVGDGSLPYLLVQPYGKGWFIYDAALQPLLGHGGWAPGMYAYTIFRNAIQWAFQSAQLPIVKNSPWPYPYDAAVIFRHDMEGIPTNFISIEQSARFESTNGASGDYYLCTGTLRLDMPNPTFSNTLASLRRAMTNYGANLYQHNGGLTNVNPVYNPRLVPVEPNLPYLLANGWLTIFEPYGAPSLAPPLNTNGFCYDYWHWSPDEILGATNLLGGFTNPTNYSFLSISNAFIDMAGWGLTNGSPRGWVAPYFNATKEGSYQIEQNLGIQMTGDDKLTPFPHWIFSTQTPDKYYSILSQPVSDWILNGQVAQSLENGHTLATMQALVDAYYNLGGLINLYNHSMSDGSGMDGTLPGSYVTYSLSKPRIWSANAASIYAWWLQRSNAQVAASFSTNGVQSIATLAISGNSHTNAAVELVVPGSRYASLQITTNGVLAGTNVYRTNGPTIKLRVGDSVSNVVVSYILPPVIQDNFYQLAQGGSLAVPAPGVLTNGTAGATAVLKGGPANGTLTFNADGSFTYTPTNNFTGVDNFTYEAVSGSLTSAVATATLMVTTAGELFYDTLTRPAGSSSIFPWVNVLGTWGVTNGVLIGSSSFSSYGYAYYSANWTNYSVQAQVRVSSTNAWGGAIGGRLNPVTGARYTLWVYPENSPWAPMNGVAAGRATLQIIKYETWTDFTAQRLVPLPGMGTNFHTVRMTFQGNTVSAYFDGVLITNLVDNGTFDAQPAFPNGGIDVETYTQSPTAFALMVDNVMVTTVTTANNDTYTNPANAILQVSAPGVLANDSSGSGSLTAQLAGGPIHGALTLTNNGGFTYTPVTNYVGTDSFTYRATDGQTTSTVATVTITMTSNASVPPMASNDVYTVFTNITSHTPSPGVLSNDFGGGGPLTAILGSGPAFGSLTLTNNGGFSYTPTSNFSGVDLFNYRATDGQNTSAVATAAVVVVPGGRLFNDHFERPPGNNLIFPWKLKAATPSPFVVPNPDGIWFITNTSIVGASITFYTYTFAYVDNPGWSNYSVQAQIRVSSTNSVGGGLGGRLDPATGARYCVWMYPENSPDGLLNGLGSMMIYKYSDWSTFTEAGLIPVPPVIGTNEHTVRLTFRGNSLQAYIDGILVTNWTDNGSFDGRPPYTNGGIDVEVYQFLDTYPTTVRNVTVDTLTPVTLAGDDSYTNPPNSTLSVNAGGVLINDASGSAAALTAQLVGGPAHGTLTLTNNGGFAYTPASNYFGTDAFTYRATDGQTTSSVATVTITLASAIPLTANNDSYTVVTNTVYNVPSPGVLNNDAGGNGPLAAVPGAGPAFGSLTLTNNGGFSYTPAANFAGLDSFTYRVTDGQATSTLATVQLMTMPAGYLYYEGFRRPGNGSTIFPWVNQLGTWGITNNVLLGTCGLDNYGYAYYQDASWTDYAVQARIRYAASNVWGGAVGGRLNPATGARYTVWVYPENSPWGPMNGVPAGRATLQIIKYRTWTDYVAQNLIQLPAVGTNWHDVALACQGTNVFAYFDGVRITNLVDNGAFDGQPALTNGGVSIDMYAASPTAYTIAVSNVAVFPLVFDQSYNTKKNTSLVVTNPGVLANALDVYGTNLAAILVSGPTNGTLNLSSNGGFTYTPATNFTGMDGFTFQAKDLLKYLGTAKATITVIPVPTLTVTADNQARTYGTANPIFTVSYNGFVNGDGTNVLTGAPALSTSAGTNSPVGNYTITVSQGTLGATNYIFQFVNGTLAVNPAALTVTARNTNKIYGQTMMFGGTEFSSSGLVNGDTVSNVTLSSSGAAAAAGVAGSPYAINVTNATGGGLANYAISYQPGTLTVNPAGLTVSARDTNKVYGQAMTFAGTEFSSSGLVNGDTVSNVTLSSSGAAATAGVAGSPYAINATNAAGGGLANYAISYQPGTLTVNPAGLTVSARDTNKIYGQTMTFGGTEFSSSGLVNGDTVSNVTLSSSGAVATAGVAGSPYAINATNAAGGGLANYAISYQPGTLTVNLAGLTVTARDTNKIYGQTMTFGGTEFSSSGLVNGDTVSNVTLSSSGAAATAGVAGSPYAINATNAAGGGLANYAISYQPGTLTVNPAGLTVSADDKTRMYSLTNPVLTVSYDGFVNGEGIGALLGSPALNTTATPASPAGTYPITVAPGTLSSDNYGFSFTNGTLTVTPAPVPVILSFDLTNQVVTLTWSSVDGAIYELQSTTNLMRNIWMSILPEVTATGSTASQTNFIGDIPAQFYRVMLKPAGP